MESTSVVQNASPGSICEIHNLYRTKRDQDGNTSWTKEFPEDLIQPAEGAESSAYALVVKNTKCYDGHKRLQIHSIHVQSELLKKFLIPVLAKYPGITMLLDRVEFKKPFKPFVHRWKEFVSAREAEQDPSTKQHVDLLYGALKAELEDTIARKSDLLANGVVTHDLLWALFQPGDTVFTGVVDARPRAFTCGSGDIDSKGIFRLNGSYVEFDGSISLPPKYHKDKAAIQEQLIARGKLWESFKGYHYRQYDGAGKGSFLGRQIKFNVKGRIVIDTDAYCTFNPDEDIYLSSAISNKLFNDERLIATPVLRGYALKEKKWLEFFVDNVSGITWNTRAFESLVLPERQHHLKKLILAVAKSSSKKLDDFDDVFQGKGRGVIMLLSGPPGVGKTLTAEGVAEVMKVPLYVLSAGDLGTNPSQVEESLKDILTIVPRWGAVLLLDEADVFMEARNSADLARNELVSIFLRVLEYYEGILFLTSNRAKNMDPAFESQIHVSIRYPELDATSRKQIWTQFIGDSNLRNVCEDELAELAELELNGRQIKNILRTAHLLAQEQNTGISYEDIKAVLDLRSI
ncbi:unnamed protein product [Penicillium pancosmium]